MEIFTSVLSILFGMVFLWIGGEGLVRGSSSIALRHSISKLVVGLTIIAFGTSMPELAASLAAVIRGVLNNFDAGDPANPANLALGNVIGSNIANIGLILGMSALIKPFKVQRSVISFEMPFVIVVSVIVVIMISIGDVISRLDGVILLCIFAVYIAYCVLNARRKGEFDKAEKISKSGTLDAAFVIFGGAALVFGAESFVRGSVSLATHFGVPMVFIGLSVVALGTSLPEFATSIVAVLKGDSEFSIGMVIGSNVFNLLLILGVVAIVHPLYCPIEERLIDIAVMVGIAIVTFPLLGKRQKLSRPEGLVLLLFYFSYIAWLGYMSYLKSTFGG